MRGAGAMAPAGGTTPASGTTPDGKTIGAGKSLLYSGSIEARDSPKYNCRLSGPCKGKYKTVACRRGWEGIGREVRPQTHFYHLILLDNIFPSSCTAFSQAATVS